MKEVKVERSLVVSSRIDLVSLMRLDKFWESKKGVRINSMSQLVSWSIDLLVDVLEGNQLVGNQGESIVDAHRHFETKGLYQKSNLKKNRQKISAGIRFSNIREQGRSPMFDDGVSYKILHNKNSVEPYEGRDNRIYIPPQEEMIEMAKNALKRIQESKANAEEQAEEFKTRNIMAENERNPERVIAENDLESQLEWLKNNSVVAQPTEGSKDADADEDADKDVDETLRIK